MRFIKYYSGNEIKENEMDKTYDTYGGRKVVYRILVGKPEGNKHLEDLIVDGRIVLEGS